MFRLLFIFVNNSDGRFYSTIHDSVSLIKLPIVEQREKEKENSPMEENNFQV